MELEKCECDNTHQKVNSVCRFCWERGRREWDDPEIVDEEKSESILNIPSDES